MKVAKAVVEQRRAELAEWIKQRRYLSIKEVCEKFAISEATARRDLRALEFNNVIVRAFGGALGEFDQTFQSFASRMEASAEGKKAIARKAADFVQDGNAVFLDGGTTLFFVARELSRRRFENLHITTNNLAAAEALAETDGIRVTLTGGDFLGRQSVLLGTTALKTLRSSRFDLALLGGLCIDAQGIYNTRQPVIELQHTVIDRSRNTFLCLDRTKFGPSGDDLFLPLAQIPDCITDASPADIQKAGAEPFAHRFISAGP